MAEMVRFMCPKLRCRAILTAPATARGEDVRCPQCATRIKVPGSKKKKSSDEGNSKTHLVEPI